MKFDNIDVLRAQTGGGEAFAGGLLRLRDPNKVTKGGALEESIELHKMMRSESDRGNESENSMTALLIDKNITLSQAKPLFPRNDLARTS